MLPQLRENVPATFGKYIEPFAGSACLFFSIEPKRAVLSDLNERLIETYKTVAIAPAAVARKLGRIPTGSEAYYEVRSTYKRLRNPVSRAATFIYLNRFCFNGLYRTNRLGQFNVPYGAPRSAAVPGVVELEKAAIAIANSTLISGDFERIVLEHANANDFVYLDPPFHTTTSRVFTQYNAKPFAGEDFGRLTSLIRKLDRRGCKFLLSYAHSAEAVKAFAPFNLGKIVTRRNISGFPQHRGVAKELLVRNFE